MLIKQADAAKIAGYDNRQALAVHKKRPFFVSDEKGRIMVDDEHPDWKLFLIQRETGLLKKAGRPRKDGKPVQPVRVSKVILNDEDEEETETKKESLPPEIEKTKYTPGMGSLADQSVIADYKSKIFESRIKEEKAKQEEIKTAELKKELAPMYLIKHFYSFGENMIHRSFRINHEIIPELNALFLSGKLQEAEQLLNERQETIVRESQADLIKAMREEGYEPTGL